MEKFSVQPGFRVKKAKLKAYQTVDINRKIEIFDSYQNSFLEELLNIQKNKLEEIFQNSIANEKRKSYDEGFKKGIVQTETKYQSQVQNTISLFQNLMKNIKEKFPKMIQENEEDILELTLLTAKKIVGESIKIEPAIVLEILKNSLSLLTDHQQIKIFVNPNSWETVTTGLKTLNIKFELPKNTQIIADEDVDLGGCRIETATETIDGDISTQFDEIQRKLLNK
jgi:flagellar assembly protein FliH